MKRNCFILVFIMLIMFSLTSCSKYYEEIDAIEPEVDYSFVYISGYEIIKDRKEYDFNSMARKTMNKSLFNDSYDVTVVDDDIYFLFEYKRHGYYDDNKYENYYTFDVSFMKVNIDTLNCELVYDFNDVYALYNNDLGSPYFLEVFDKNRALIEYNGYIQILDLNTKQIVESVYAYDEWARRLDKDGYYHYGFNKYGDFKYRNGTTLYYYELDEYKFKHHTFTINENTDYIYRYKNYIYTSDWKDGGYVYYDCYDLETDESYDFNLIKKEIYQSQNEEEKEVPVINIDDKTYHFDMDYKTIKIYDEEDSLFKTIDIERILENDACKKILEAREDYFEIYYYQVIDNKLLITVSSRRCPHFIYEYDIKNDVIKYVGYTPANSIVKFYLVYK